MVENEFYECMYVCYGIELRYVRVSAAGEQQHSTHHAPKLTGST